MRKKYFRIFFLLFTFCSGVARASPESSDPNDLLRFQRIFIEPVQDEMAGVFDPLIRKEIRTVLRKNPRFQEAIQLNQADSILRTQIQKKFQTFEVTVSLLLNPTQEIFAERKAELHLHLESGLENAEMQQLLIQLFQDVPFAGTVKGREKDKVILDVGSAQGVEAGDEVQISRLDRIRRHPMLKKILDVQLLPVGSIIIEDAEEFLSFGKIKEELPGEKIRAGLKVSSVEKNKELSMQAAPSDSSEIPGKFLPKLGFVGLGLSLAQFSSNSSSAALGAKTYSSFNPGAALLGELWLTRHWFAEANVVLSSHSTSSTQAFSFAFGYRFLPEKSLYGPQFFLKAGYSYFKWQTEVNPALLLAPKTYTGLLLGLGAQLPIQSWDWGLFMRANVNLFPNAEEGASTKRSASSASAVQFAIGGYHHFDPQWSVRVSFFADFYSSEFKDSGAQASDTSQKNVGILPAVLYSF